MRLESSFGAPASPARAWTLLTDVQVVVHCMPGAELVEQVDETTWTANVKVELGPSSMPFRNPVARPGTVCPVQAGPGRDAAAGGGRSLRWRS